MYVSTSFDVMKRYNCYCKTRIIWPGEYPYLTQATPWWLSLGVLIVRLVSVIAT